MRKPITRRQRDDTGRGMRNFLIVSYIALLMPISDCWADGLDSLIELGKSQAEIQREYADETRTFEKVKKAVESGAIAKGQTESAIRERYGEPVVAVKDLDGKRKDWVYKPAASSFFEGVKITLVFTEEGLLDEIR